MAKGKFHQTILQQETLAFLNNKPGYYIDGTVGGGGHARKLLAENPEAWLIGIDRDPEALNYAHEALAEYKERVTLIQDDFKNFLEVMSKLGVDELAGFLLDLGVSSHQLDTPTRGFSYHLQGPLDMRMSPGTGMSAQDVVNKLSEKDLTDIIRRFGEERWAHRIATAIVKARREEPITSTEDLVNIIRKAVPPRQRVVGPHPARRTFQALRIFVNEELAELGGTIAAAVDRLVKGGRICIISFHSLEDRIVKRTFRELSVCQCPKSLPCQCGGPVLTVLTSRPVTPTQEEIASNRRARSAKLRAGEKI